MVNKDISLVILGIIIEVAIIVFFNTSALNYARTGDDHLRAGQYDKAIEAFTKAINKGSLDLKVMARIYNSRGYAYNAEGKLDDAMKDCNRAIELNPEYAQAYSDRGVIFLEVGKEERALADFDKATDIDPNYFMTYYYKASFYSERDNPSEACKWLRMAIEKGYKNWSHIKNDSNLDNIRRSACYAEIMSGR